MKILAIDPSSTCCGWAVLCGSKPALSSFGKSHSSKTGSLARIDAMTDELLGIAHSAGAQRVVLEWSSGKVHGRLGRVAGLAVLGQAQGSVREAFRRAGFDVWTVGENEWTGSVPKVARAERIAFEFPAYREWAAKGKDRGLDVADAIGLGCFWLRNQQYAALAAGRR